MKAFPFASVLRTALVLFSILSVFSNSDSHALSLRDFLKGKSALRASVKLAYLRELEVLRMDPAYCSKDDSYPGMFDACKEGIRDEQSILIQPDWGRDWTLESSAWVPTFGEVLTFRKANILRPNAPMQCEVKLSIPANKPRTKRFSFDIYCDH